MISNLTKKIIHIAGKMIQQNNQHEHGMNTHCSISAKISEHAVFNVLEIWLDIVTDFKLGNLL